MLITKSQTIMSNYAMERMNKEKEKKIRSMGITLTNFFRGLLGIEIILTSTFEYYLLCLYV